MAGGGQLGVLSRLPSLLQPCPSDGCRIDAALAILQPCEQMQQQDRQADVRRLTSDTWQLPGQGPGLESTKHNPSQTREHAMAASASTMKQDVWGEQAGEHLGCSIDVLKSQHQELLVRLSNQDDMLSRLLERPVLALPRTRTGVSERSRTSRDGVVRHTRQYEDDQADPEGDAVDKADSVSPSQLDMSSLRPNIFVSYTQTDLEHKEQALHVGSKSERRRFASLRNSRAFQGSERRIWKALVQHPSFEVFFGMVVLTNAVFIGVDVEQSLGSSSTPVAFQVLQYAYAFLFTLEFVARLMAFGLNLFLSDDALWSLLDAVVVLSSLWDIGVDIVAASRAGTEDAGGFAGVSSLKAFRVVRITRIVKAIRLMKIFRFVMALRTLVTSIFHTLKSLFWALILLAIIVYCFAILFVQAVNDYRSDVANHPLSHEMVSGSDRFFKNLPDTMLSLFMSIGGGVSWEEVLVPLRGMSAIWVWCFLFYISFTYFAVLNVVTGVFCQSAIESAQNDHTAVVQSILADKQAHLQKIRDLFGKLGDQDGVITYTMFEEKINSPAVREYFESLGLDVWDAWTFFKLLDQDAGDHESCSQVIDLASEGPITWTIIAMRVGELSAVAWPDRFYYIRFDSWRSDWSERTCIGIGKLFGLALRNIPDPPPPDQPPMVLAGALPKPTFGQLSPTMPPTYTMMPTIPDPPKWGEPPTSGPAPAKMSKEQMQRMLDPVKRFLLRPDQVCQQLFVAIGATTRVEGLLRNSFKTSFRVPSAGMALPTKGDLMLQAMQQAADFRKTATQQQEAEVAKAKAGLKEAAADLIKPVQAQPASAVELGLLPHSSDYNPKVTIGASLLRMHRPCEMPEFRYAQMTCSGVPSSCFHVLGRRPETQPAAKRELRQVWSCCQVSAMLRLVTGMPILLAFLWHVAASSQEMAQINPADLNAIGELYVPVEHICDGYQEQWDNCPGLEPCGPCEPRDCTMGPWSPWQLQGGCTGLQLRHREVEVTANHCGQPCNEALTETAAYVLDECKPKGQDCKFSTWQEWSECKNKKDYL
ncbi:Cacna1e [Symbiodinium sp. KB8]|nr:Cacna1e [Symbiodinium sp. KB8]